MKQYSTLVLMFLLALSTQAQTLVNRAWKSTTGSPKESINHLAGAATYTYVVLVGNTYTVGQEENMLITKYNFSGDILWQTEYNVGDTLSDLGLDVYIEGGYIYVTGASMATDLSTSSMATLKLDVDSGHIQWDTAYAGSYGGITMAGTMVVDSLGNAYVAGSEQTGFMDAQLTVVKYNSLGQQQWVMHYDSIGLIDGGAGLALDDTSLVLAGFSGSTFGSWHFVSARLATATGALQSIRFAPNANGGLEELVNTTQDYEGNTFILGTALAGPGNTDLKLIKYDANFNEQWAVTWGNPDSTDDVPGYLITDSEGNLVVTGSAGNTGGGTDLLTLRYSNVDGSLMWQRRYGAANPAGHAAGYDIATAPPGSSGPVYIAGSTHNGTNLDYLTLSYDLEGNLRWARTMDDTLGSNDEARDIQLSGGGVVVSGISKLPGGGTRYVTVKYEEFEKHQAPVQEDGIPRYMDNQAIILFGNNVLKDDFVNDRDALFARADKVFKPSAYLYFAAKLPTQISRCVFVKIFPELTKADTLMVSRFGDTIASPKFYNALQMVCDISIDEQAICDSFNRSYPMVNYSHLNYTALPQSDEPDDPYFTAGQPSLGDQDINVGSINILPAWELVTGSPSVRVGIIDDAVDGFHEDFGGTDSTFMQGKVQGWDFQNNMDLLLTKLQPTPSINHIPWYSQHGNAMAGIVGALRNNGIGIAGVAGGDIANGNQGVSIYNPRAFNALVTDDSLEWFDGAAIARTIFNSALAGDSLDGIFYRYGLHAMNNSYVQGYLTGYNPLNYNKLHLLRDAVHAVNRLGVVFMAARGQNSSNNLVYPSCYNDDWVINVAGTGLDGTWEHNVDNPRDIGGPIDIAAPSHVGLTTTLRYDLQYHTPGYYQSGGTSEATAYVTGAVSLMLSYYNTNRPADEALRPEDVEYVLEHTATPTGDDPKYVGSGRLNVTDAVYMLHQPERFVRHKNNLLASMLSDTITLVDSMATIRINEPVTYYATINSPNDTSLNLNLDTGVYKMNVYEYSCWVKNDLPNNDSIIAYWPLHSQTSLWNYYAYDTTLSENILQPYEKCYVDTVLRDSTLLHGYFYQVFDATADTLLRWLPQNTIQPVMAFSLLTNDNGYVPTHVPEDLRIKTWLYPNPAQEMSYLSVVTNSPEYVSIKMYDVLGRTVRQIYEGPIEATKNFNLNLSSCQRGTYIIGIETDSGTKTIKMVKL